MTVSACIKKNDLITLYGPEHVRYGEPKDINLTNFLPQYLEDTDTEVLLSVYQEYLNEMYDGSGGFTLGSSALSVDDCETSGCLLSAIDNNYTHDTYVSSGGVSAHNVLTPSDDVDEVFVDNFCQRPKTKISILEKTSRLLDLFDSDLIPMDLIQFYAQNLGYEVGLSRDNIGFAGSSNVSEEAIKQKKYLRFMIRNLPTWYKIKTTRNSVKMMLFSFGLVGDFIYYFTKNYIDDETGIGLNTLEYQNNNTVSGDEHIEIQDIDFNKMTYKEFQKFKCESSEWEEFKKNRLLYLEMLQDIQTNGKNDWILTDVNSNSVNEDLVNIPDEYFSTPHFRLWFDILESLVAGNYSTDLHKQKLISNAIMAIKPINTVFEGVTGRYQTLVNRYMKPYTRIRKHMVFISDGSADAPIAGGVIIDDDYAVIMESDESVDIIMDI